MSKITGKVNYKEVLKGDTGYTFEPHVTVDGILYWSNNGNLPNPLPVNIKGKNGDMTQEEEINNLKTQISIISTKFYGTKSDKNIEFNFIENKYNHSYDNLINFKNAFSNEKSISIPYGDYYISDTIEINNPIYINGNNCNIYFDPKKENTTIFKINSDNVHIENINFISENVNKPIIGNNDVKGKSSNLYALEICSNNVKINNVNSENCFTPYYVYGLENELINNIEIKNFNSFNSVFGFFCRYCDNLIVKSGKISLNKTGLNDYAHHIYIGTESHNIVFKDLFIMGGTDTLYDCISLHDSIKNELTITNVKFENIEVNCNSRNIITLSNCEEIYIKNSEFKLTGEVEKGCIQIQDIVNKVFFSNCSFNIDNGYSIVNYSGNTNRDNNINLDLCNFYLSNINAVIFKYVGNLCLTNSNIYISSPHEKYISLFHNLNNIIKYNKKILFNNINIILDNNTTMDKIIICDSENTNDIITLNKINIINTKLINYAIRTNGKSKINVYNSTFINYNNLCESNINQLNNFTNLGVNKYEDK